MSLISEALKQARGQTRPDGRYPMPEPGVFATVAGSRRSGRKVPLMLAFVLAALAVLAAGLLGALYLHGNRSPRTGATPTAAPSATGVSPQTLGAIPGVAVGSGATPPHEPVPADVPAAVHPVQGAATATPPVNAIPTPGRDQPRGLPLPQPQAAAATAAAPPASASQPDPVAGAGLAAVPKTPVAAAAVPAPAPVAAASAVPSATTPSGPAEPATLPAVAVPAPPEPPVPAAPAPPGPAAGTGTAAPADAPPATPLPSAAPAAGAAAPAGDPAATPPPTGATQTQTGSVPVGLAPPEIRKQYRLSGILRGEAGSLAIINGGFFSAGDELGEQVRVTEVSDQHVQIEANGWIYRLSLTP